MLEIGLGWDQVDSFLIQVVFWLTINLTNPPKLQP